MYYSVLEEHCGFKGTEREFMRFDTLIEAMDYYHTAISEYDYYYAGNDYNRTHKPMIIWDYPVEKNQHNFWTHPDKRIKHNSKIAADKAVKIYGYTEDEVKDVDFNNVDFSTIDDECFIIDDIPF